MRNKIPNEQHIHIRKTPINFLNACNRNYFIKQKSIKWNKNRNRITNLQQKQKNSPNKGENVCYKSLIRWYKNFTIFTNCIFKGKLEQWKAKKKKKINMETLYK